MISKVRHICASAYSDALDLRMNKLECLFLPSKVGPPNRGGLSFLFSSASRDKMKEDGFNSY